MLRIRLPDEAGIGVLEEAILAVLEDVGMVFQNDRILGALEQAGARIDPTSQIAKFPRRMCADFVGSIRREAARRTGSTDQLFETPSLPALTTQVAQFIYDYDKRERRPGTRQDLVELVKLGDVLHREAGVGHCLLLRDVPPILEPLEAALVLAEYAHQPHPAFAWNVEQSSYLAEMGEIMGLPRWYAYGAVCIAHPLRFDRAVADRYVEMMRAGYRAGLTAMPVAGLSTPITLEGFIVVSSAEMLGAWIAGRALNPEVALGGSMWCGTPDMKTGHVSFSAFDAVFYSVAFVQFVERWCGLRVEVGKGEYCAAKQPGVYAALEKAYKAMTVAAFTGRHPEVGEGMLDCGKLLSDVQLLLDREMAMGLDQFSRTLAPDQERVALPAIAQVGVSGRSSHLPSDHTARHFRHSLWLPELLERVAWDGPEQEARMLQRIRDKAIAMVSDYRQPEGREHKLKAMRAVLERARRDLL
jgi:trimethylamine:corrinoid methyltransferase-like protein